MELIFLIKNPSYIANQLKTSNFKKFIFLNTLSDLDKNNLSSDTIFILDFSKVLNFSKKENLMLNTIIDLNHTLVYVYDAKHNFNIKDYKTSSNIKFLNKSFLKHNNFLEILTKFLFKKSDIYIYNNLKLNFNDKALFINNSEINLTTLEYELLEYFILHKNKVLCRKTLIKEVWGYSFLGSSRTIDTHIKSLRKKIYPYRNLIKTVWGKGYVFKD